MVNQGDVYWVQLTDAGGLEPGIPHPHVVIDQSAETSVTVCALTSNLKRSSLLGNVLLEAGEANLPKPSVVEISKVTTIEKAQLGEYIGSLTPERINEILAGMRFLQLSYFNR